LCSGLHKLFSLKQSKISAIFFAAFNVFTFSDNRSIINYYLLKDCTATPIHRLAQRLKKDGYGKRN